MADISKISVSGVAYDVKDAAARTRLTNIESGTQQLNVVSTTGGKNPSQMTAGDASIGRNLEVLGATTLNGNLTVIGDINQTGSSYETHAEKLYTKKDLIITREGATGALGTDEYTGILAENYDGANNFGALVFDKNGIARVGDVTESDNTLDYTNTEALATREDAPNVNGIAFWNSSDSQFHTANPTFNVLVGAGTVSDSKVVHTATIGITAYTEGMTVKAIFTDGSNTGNTTAPTGLSLNIDSLGVKDIYVNVDGTPTLLSAKQLERVSGQNYYWYVQPYTTLELIYISSLGSAGGWLVVGNPIVLSSTASGYTIYADGKRVIVSTTDIGAGTTLNSGDIYYVVES